MGVWIEIGNPGIGGYGVIVTPFMGVWIEILNRDIQTKIMHCHTLYGCVD